MATAKSEQHTPAQAPATGLHWRRFFPFLDWLPHYRRQDLVGDVMAGIIVAIMLVPQSMAYAMLAGLPPEIGLYASILPLIIYGLMGTSRTLAVGPVAIMSLITASGLSGLAEAGTPAYISLALMLSLLVGILRVGMGLLRLGFLVNFLSHPVLSGFVSAAAVVIGLSQLKHLLGFAMPRGSVVDLLAYAAANIQQTNLVTLAIGLGSVALLLYFKHGLGTHLATLGLPEAVRLPLTRGGPLLVVLLGTLLVWGLRLDAQAGVSVVGAIPAGLPPLTLPGFDLAIWQALLPTALTLALVGSVESISVAKSLASKRRQKVDPDQELIALGAANFGAAFTGGYPVTGGFSRSMVNFTAGANTGLASIITALLVAVTVVFLTPIFYYLPQAVLAAIVMVAVATLIDVKTPLHVWHYNKADAAALFITFFAVLTIGVELGILLGVAVTIVLFLWRTSRPHVAIVGRVGDSETYRNVLRHNVSTCPHVVAIRVDESLYFANTKYLEETLLRTIAEHPEVKHLVLIGSSVNFVDYSALETLETLVEEMRNSGVEVYLAEFKGPVTDSLRKGGFLEHLGEDKLFLSTHRAMLALKCA